ncbi:MAG: hypothetical protein A3I75_07350 [Deltaproteobacteria bacterium RIFCSPLOWO2_02_FULL_50_16]|nr:MAG: hypothetical protein A3I75_07350 [Deltaproteobacteria bacterium RIFCSPLOWO2_02_FULL_50_16]
MTGFEGQIEYLSRGDILVTTPQGHRIQFGLSANTVKDTMPPQGGDGKFQGPGRFPDLFVLDPHTALNIRTGQDRLFPEFPGYWGRYGYPYLVTGQVTETGFAPGPSLAYNLTSTPEMAAHVAALYDISYQSLDSSTFREAHPDFDSETYYLDMNMAGELEYWRRTDPRDPLSRLIMASDLFNAIPMDASGTMVLGALRVQSVGPGRYEIFEENRSLGQIDLPGLYAESPVQERKPQILDKRVLEIRERLLHSGEPGWVAISASSGFDPKEGTSGFILFNEGRAILIDPPVGTIQFLERYGIPESAIEGVLITHTHEDHDQGLLEQLSRGRHLRLYATEPVRLQLIEKLYHKFQGRWPRQAISRLWNFQELRLQETQSLLGLDVAFYPTFHSNAALGLEIREGGRVVFSFSGDTNANRDLVKGLGDDRAGRPIMSEARMQEVALRPFEALRQGGISVVDRGAFPLHTPNGPLIAEQEAARALGSGGVLLAYHNSPLDIHPDLRRIGLGLDGAVMLRAQQGFPTGLSGSHKTQEAVLEQMVARTLAHHAILGSLPDTERAALAQRWRGLTTYQPGEVLVHEGRPMDSLLLPTGGRVDIYKDGQRLDARPAETMGYEALWDPDRVSPHTVRADTVMDVFAFPLTDPTVRRLLQTSYGGEPSAETLFQRGHERHHHRIGIALYEHSEWFRNLDSRSQDFILVHGMVRTLKAGQLIAGHNAPRGLDVLIRGGADHYWGEDALENMRRGDLIGDIPLMGRSLSRYAARAFTNVTLLHLSETQVQDMCRKSSRARALTVDHGIRTWQRLREVRALRNADPVVATRDHAKGQRPRPPRGRR